MVISWVHVATLVVVTLAFTHCEQSLSNRNINNGRGDRCPCLPAELCPRVFGTKPEDAKYLGDVKKCDDPNAVRCCGASASFVVGTTTPTPKAEPISTTTQVTDILSRLNPDDDNENEISDSESESEIFTSTFSAKNEQTEISAPKEGNIENFHQKQFKNDEIDEETAESESITEHQSLDDFEVHDIEGSTEEGLSSIEAVPTETQPISHRKPKKLDNVITVYPNFMSGIPQTTPKNMPESNELKMFDKDTGMDVHLVFSRTTIKPELTTHHEPRKELRTRTTEPSSNANPTGRQSHYKFAKRRRQYRPIQSRTTESPAEDLELVPTTMKSRKIMRASTRVKRPSPQELSNSTIRPSRARTTRVPVIQEEEDVEILHTSDDDKTQQNRFRLFSARHRLNYLRRSTTTTTETPIEMSTRQSSQSKTLEYRKASLNEASYLKIPVSVRPSKMNETLIRRMDANHQDMISKVRVALKAASTENQIVEIPRSFASVDMDNRVKKIEKMLVSKMMNIFTEMKVKRRGDRPKTKEPSSIVQKQKISTTEKHISEPTSDTVRPFRGSKKFQLMDLLDKTLVVAMPNEVRRMRIRSTTVKPVEEVTKEITTTRRPRRRPTTTIQPDLEEKKNLSPDSTFPAKNQERQFRRRNNIRRKFTVESTPITTIAPPVRTTSEIITTVEYTEIPTASPTTASTTTEAATTITIATTPISTESTEVIDESEVIDEATEPITYDEIVTTPIDKEVSDVSAEFKPSPLWSIKSGEQSDFIEVPNHSYHMDGLTNEKSNRRSRNAFEPPMQYMNGFIPVNPFNVSI